MKITLEYSKISDVDLAGVDMSDYPKFSDAYICNAVYDGREMSDAELELLNSDGNFVHEQVLNKLF